MQDSGPLGGQVFNDRVLIVPLCVCQQEAEEREEESTEEREKMNAKLDTHWTLIPSNSSPQISLQFSETVNIIARL